jgi:hypothetical protein
LSKEGHCLALGTREEVLGDLEGTNHQNIRNFRLGRNCFYGEALTQNNQEVTIILQYMRWTIKPKPSDDKIKHLAQALNVEDFVAQLLVQRGIETFEDAKLFFRPSLEHLHDPYLMKDMDKAVRIETAIENQERILVFEIMM